MIEMVIISSLVLFLYLLISSLEELSPRLLNTPIKCSPIGLCPNILFEDYKEREKGDLICVTTQSKWGGGVRNGVSNMGPEPVFNRSVAFP